VGTQEDTSNLKDYNERERESARRIIEMCTGHSEDSSLCCSLAVASLCQASPIEGIGIYESGLLLIIGHYQLLILNFRL
jgi:hypothetical protein